MPQRENALVYGSVYVGIAAVLTLIAIIVTMGLDKVDIGAGIWVIASMVALIMSCYYIITRTDREITDDKERIYIPLVLIVLSFTFVSSIYYWYQYQFEGGSGKDAESFQIVSLVTLGFLLVYTGLLAKKRGQKKFVFYFYALIIPLFYFVATLVATSSKDKSNKGRLIATAIVSGLIFVFVLVSLFVPKVNKKLFSDYSGISSGSKDEDFKFLSLLAAQEDAFFSEVMHGNSENVTPEQRVVITKLRQKTKDLGIKKIFDDLEEARDMILRGEDIDVNEYLLKVGGINKKDWVNKVSRSQAADIESVRANLSAKFRRPIPANDSGNWANDNSYKLISNNEVQIGGKTTEQLKKLVLGFSTDDQASVNQLGRKQWVSGYEALGEIDQEARRSVIQAYDELRPEGALGGRRVGGFRNYLTRSGFARSIDQNIGAYQRGSYRQLAPLLKNEDVGASNLSGGRSIETIAGAEAYRDNLTTLMKSRVKRYIKSQLRADPTIQGLNAAGSDQEYIDALRNVGAGTVYRNSAPAGMTQVTYNGQNAGVLTIPRANQNNFTDADRDMLTGLIETGGLGRQLKTVVDTVVDAAKLRENGRRLLQDSSAEGQALVERFQAAPGGKRRKVKNYLGIGNPSSVATESGQGETTYGRDRLVVHASYAPE